MRTVLLALSLVVILAGTSCRQPAERIGTAPGNNLTAQRALPGKQADGSVLLPNQRSLRPVGRQVELGDFPISVAIHPGGRFATVLHSGYSTHQIVVVDIPSATVAS